MAETVRAFVTGYPVRHSRSPMIHGHWLKQAGIAGRYEAVEVSPEDFPAFMKSLADGTSGFVGGNVTIPHKQAAFELAGEADALANGLGAANTLWLEDGRLRATNTDGYGFCANLDEWSPGWDKARKAVILGAGGASRAIIQAVQDRGVRQIHIVNRTVARAMELADRFSAGISAHPLDALNEVTEGAGLFVNTSALGMEGTPVPRIDFSKMAAGAVVTDIVYTPLITPIMRMAQDQGLNVVDGLGMLLHQAVPGFEKWFGIRPHVTRDLRDLVVADLEAEK
ncbi:shikimate dehydrogenase [Hoeflea poritis]|uniref:Shikimate dehydrogenase (NADP(+)) n=1 Tax=Hoeflea poritis TaxID=2993659 RepID=A0ABT4VKW8_9HYPH|nr:shikimate dehydrogenase [Hoeflea poritis]MDA4845346.1 shikimate dehydrogenase [Hoeflea poritis]